MSDSPEAPTQDPSPPSQRFYLLMTAMMALFFVYTTAVTWTQYQGNLVFSVDAGYFDHLLSGWKHSRGLQWAASWELENANYFGAHFRPIIFLIMPIYFLIDHVMVYLTALNTALVLAAWPLMLFAFRRLASEPLALLVGLLYLTNHFVGSIHLANHPESLVLPFLFLLYYALERRWIVVYTVACLCAFAVKEDIAIYLGAFGASLLISKDTRKWGIYTILGSIAWFAFALLMMNWNGQEAITANPANKPVRHFADFGDSKGEVAKFLITHPWAPLPRLFTPTLFWLFASVGFLALLDWRRSWLIVLGAGVFMITGNPLIGKLHYYYSYPAIGPLFYSTVVGLAFFKNRLGDRRGFTWGFAALLAIFSVINAALPTRTDGYRRWLFPVDNHDRLASEIVHLIPRDASVAAQFDVYTKVPNRKVKLPLRADYLDLVDYLFLDQKGRAPDLNSEQLEAINAKLDDGDFELLFEGDGYLLLKRVEEE